MGRLVCIDPVTRIEGQARISLHLDDAGVLVDARLHVLEVRGFEAFCVGRPFTDMGAITSRICGICPVSHLLAAARAGDQLLAVTIPAAARQLRELLNLAQILQSHALSFFHLSCPDLLLGWDSDPARRNLFGLMAAEPDLARAGIRLRQFGQRIIELLAGRAIHGLWALPGGVLTPLGLEAQAWILDRLPEARAAARLALERYKTLLDGPLQQEQTRFGRFPSLFLALVGPQGRWAHLDGDLRLADAAGAWIGEPIDPLAYGELIAEAVEPWSYLKFPYIRSLGYPEGIYRVGPLARLNVCRGIGTPWAEAELVELRQRSGPVLLASFAYHHARLVEIVVCLEAIERLVEDPGLRSAQVRAKASLNRQEAVGVSEAPRGTLFHHYRVDPDGLITHVNLIIATGQNNLAINRTLLQVARATIPSPLAANAEIPEAILNRVEAGLRCFDPCLSCSTHAAGQMPLLVQLIDARGELLAERSR
jgi:NAD-reducing hydrogenase large subunit